ncbi:uncharacterized protein K460DRAFT_333581 [Cucurbitaria berberidis CBS 394.84]|uniref:Telomeric single stranded DNA binding POT1/Cdc13 domain-containing protein n=1 Tax=Cucurbitaria berberidis CBS 394.84 TaxID=1168544 RepID=A0A9P4LBA5_9PLEO|nr:uncharacterized protein K460DRAFT_333581 [Cucurbitaria berberidis CBS 394.84]KAF1847999.1 hypothetical protein K460DRAFT_333581 [Cucurbitaria berberidis CBS 394.84]
MDRVGISELNPELPALESKQFKATVTLIWPYSSSARQFALLLADPDFRLRRKKGQVRARFSGSCAKAIATTSIGIGDEVILSLQGAQFVQEGAVNTPGKGIDWELSYTQTVVVQVFRNGSELANLNLVDVAPTPAPRSPNRREPVAAPSPAQQWSSPAFLKRVRLSDGPVFEAPYDPLVEENNEGHDKKRRRKSYRDWKAWTYSARTPSPEKEQDSMEEYSGGVEASPSRPTQLPDTPVSPPKPEMRSVAAEPLNHLEDVKETHQSRATAHNELVSRPKQDDFVRDADYYELYAGPNELPPSGAQYAFGGDTEVNTEEEEVVQKGSEADSFSTTEANTDDDDRLRQIESEAVEIELSDSEHTLARKNTEIATKEENSMDVIGVRHATETLIDEAVNIYGAPTTVMPPPTLSTLQTNFPITNISALLTPIGREPDSPTLQPLDSATLPLPSPFPGERDNSIASFLDQVATVQQLAEVDATANEDLELPSDADYILETSFFSSINSSRPSGNHPSHESAFTPVRFTFGMDGAGFSRPMELSSPAPEEFPLIIEENIQADTGLSDTKFQKDSTASLDIQMPVPLSHETADVVELSSGSEFEELEESEIESNTPADNEADADGSKANVMDFNQATTNEVLDNQEERWRQMRTSPKSEIKDKVNFGIISTQPSTAGSGVFDLGSPSEDNSDEESHVTGAEPNVFDRAGSNEVNEPLQPSDAESYSGFFNLDSAHEVASATATLEEEVYPHTEAQQQLETSFHHLEEEQPFPVHDHESQFALGDSDAYMQDAFRIDELQPIPEWESLVTEEHHPDIKMESIEEDSSFHLSQPNIQQVEDSHQHHAAGSPDELIIAVPGESHVLGELHTISVPATAPARNTRSKTKASTSPSKEKTPVPKRKTRSAKSKASVTSVARTTISPSKTRTRSTASPSQDAAQSSPYSLRSQSKLLSPFKDTSEVATAIPHRSSRKHAPQNSTGSVSDLAPSQLEGRDLFTTSFELSQELNASQGRYSNVSFVKDSEEESLSSEQSISIAQHSGSWGDIGAHYTNSSNPANTRPITKATGKKTELQTVDQVKGSSPTQPSHSFNAPPPATSPSRRLRSAGAAESTSPSPRMVRRTRRHVYELSPEARESMEESPDEATPKLDITGESEGEDDHQIRSSPPPAPSELYALPSGSTATIPFINQQSLKADNMPITPDATQQTTTEPQPGFTAVQQGDGLLMTPQPTQATSRELRSFQADIDQAPMIKKSTPRRNVTSTDVASASASPHSEAASSSSDVVEAEQPSIGLSTPLAYYTPLKDLVFFLNRSSQFHSAASPDVLALVTSSSTPSEKAKKGPKHWNTTLHITDLSTWPTITTVQLFRAYQTALPHADVGDIILLRSFAVKSLNRQPMLISADESSWCVWRYGKPVWGAKRGAYGEIRAREEMNGPTVERGEGEWREVERLRTWWVEKIKRELEEKEASHVKTRSKDKLPEKENDEVEMEETISQVKTRSKDKVTEKENEVEMEETISQVKTRSKGKAKEVVDRDAEA